MRTHPQARRRVSFPGSLSRTMRKGQAIDCSRAERDGHFDETLEHLQAARDGTVSFNPALSPDTREHSENSRVDPVRQPVEGHGSIWVRSRKLAGSCVAVAGSILCWSESPSCSDPTLDPPSKNFYNHALAQERTRMRRNGRTRSIHSRRRPRPPDQGSGPGRFLFARSRHAHPSRPQGIRHPRRLVEPAPIRRR